VTGTKILLRRVCVYRSKMYNVEVEVEVEVKLRPTMSWQVCLGVGLPSGAHD
jgi:hypothetical protein